MESSLEVRSHRTDLTSHMFKLLLYAFSVVAISGPAAENIFAVGTAGSKDGEV